MLRTWVAGKAPGEPVFDLRSDVAAAVLRSDLADCGIAHAEAYDFHCTRHSYVTMVVKSGASVKVCQELARHANPKLTLSLYTHLGIGDLAEGLHGLAHLLPNSCVSTGLTGTHGGAVISSPGETQVDLARQFSKIGNHNVVERRT
jgi:hypothetical protein